MRSAWQLIKNFASRRTIEEASEPRDEVKPAPDHSRQEAAEDRAPRAESNPARGSIPVFPTESDQPIEQPYLSGAQTVESDPVMQTKPLLPEQVSDEVQELGDQTAQAPPVVQAAEREPTASASVGELKEHTANTAQAPKDVRSPTVAKKVGHRPEATKKTVVEETTELDREINDLRSQLSAKLREQNRHLRRMLERYNDK